MGFSSERGGLRGRGLYTSACLQNCSSSSGARQAVRDFPSDRCSSEGNGEVGGVAANQAQSRD
jgi:hypothetical protein